MIYVPKVGDYVVYDRFIHFGVGTIKKICGGVPKVKFDTGTGIDSSKLPSYKAKPTKYKHCPNITSLHKVYAVEDVHYYMLDRAVKDICTKTVNVYGNVEYQCDLIMLQEILTRVDGAVAKTVFSDEHMLTVAVTYGYRTYYVRCPEREG